jgi:hypothetical protein
VISQAGNFVSSDTLARPVLFCMDWGVLEPAAPAAAFLSNDIAWHGHSWMQQLGCLPPVRELLLQGHLNRGGMGLMASLLELACES